MSRMNPYVKASLKTAGDRWIEENPMATMTDAEVIAEIKTTSAFNRARRAFSSWTGRIEQRGQQRKPYTAIEMRRDEFEAVRAIAKELGVHIPSGPSKPSTPYPLEDEDPY